MQKRRPYLTASYSYGPQPEKTSHFLVTVLNSNELPCYRFQASVGFLLSPFLYNQSWADRVFLGSRLPPSSQTQHTAGPSHWSPCEVLTERKVGGEEVSAAGLPFFYTCACEVAHFGRRTHLRSPFRLCMWSSRHVCYAGHGFLFRTLHFPISRGYFLCVCRGWIHTGGS